MNSIPRQTYSTKATYIEKGGLPGVYKINKSVMEERKQYHSVESDK